MTQIGIAENNPASPFVDSCEIIMTVAELRERQHRIAYVQDLISVGDKVLIYGPTTAGKSFAALDWAVCSAAGKDWCGREVRSGAVVYVALEGNCDIVQRIDAAKKYYGILADDALQRLGIYRRAVRLLDQSIYNHSLSKMLELNLVYPPDLVILDNVNAMLRGGSVNKDEDMGLVTGLMDEIEDYAEGATVIAIHNTAKPTWHKKSNSFVHPKSYRGSQVLMDDMDVVLRLVPVGRTDLDGTQKLTLTIEKDRYGSNQGTSLNLHREVVTLDQLNEQGNPITSCVVTLDGYNGVDTTENTGNTVSDKGKILLTILKDSGGLRSGAWESKSEMPKRTYNRYRNQLGQQGLVNKVGNLYLPVQS